MLNVHMGGLLISPHCELTIKALEGADGPQGYHYAKYRLRGSLNDVYSEIPEKNAASHLADALQYFALHVGRYDPEAAARAAPVARAVAQYNAARQKVMMA
jgi:hypothetical protein